MNRHDNEGKDGTSRSRDSPPPAADVSNVNAEPEDKTFFSKIKMAGQKVYKLLSSHGGLIVLLVAYTFLGAGMFMAIEGPHEHYIKTDINALRKKFVKQIFANMSTNLTSEGNASTNDPALLVGDTNFTALLLEYEQSLFRYYKTGMGVDTRGRLWSFWGSLLFCTTVYSTIGYGHIAPVTTLGRLVTMLYAVLGIPLCLVVMADIGKLLTRGVKFLWSFIRRYYYTGHCRKIRSTKPVKFIGESIDKVTDKIARRGSYELDSEAQDPDAEKDGEEEKDEADFTAYQVDDEFNLPPIVAIIMVIIYTAIGAACYIQWEKWSYTEAFYFIFISISTIGFGDVTPEHTKFYLLSTFYILLGLSLVAMVITVIMEKVRGTIREASKKINSVTRNIGLSLADLGKSDTSIQSKDKKKKSSSQSSIQNKDETKDNSAGNISNNASNVSPLVTQVREASTSDESRGPHGKSASPYPEWQEYSPPVYGNMQTTARHT